MSSDKIPNPLERVGLFEDIDAEAQHKLFQKMQLEQFSLGDRVIEESEVGDKLYVLVEGRVSVIKKTTDGDLFRVAIFGAEKYPTFGEGGLVESESRSATIECLTDCLMLVLCREELESFSLQNPAMALKIYKRISRNMLRRLTKADKDLVLLHRALMDEIR